MAKATGKGRSARKKAVKKPAAKKAAGKAAKKTASRKKPADKKKAAAKKPALKSAALKGAASRSAASKGAAPKSASSPAKKPAPNAAPKKAAAPTGRKAKAEPPVKAAKGAKAEPAAPAPAPAPKPRSRKRRSSRRAVPPPRRGPDGELLAPGELLLPKGPQSEEEVHYLLRGCVAGEEEAGELGVTEVVEKQPAESFPDKEDRLAELREHVEMLGERFEKGPLENNLPVRAAARYTFEGIVDRAKQRRREIGAFLRGLDLARTESSHMDSHGEASLQGLMEWAARLEKLIEAEEPEQGDYAQFHRGMDQLDHTTESRLVDVEQTLKRLGKRARARK
jgi:hypothetical protein